MMIYARLYLQRQMHGKGSLGFFVTCPTDEFNKSSNTQMEISVKRRLGLPLTCLADSQSMNKCICGADLDILGDHLICCKGKMLDL